MYSYEDQTERFHLLANMSATIAAGMIASQAYMEGSINTVSVKVAKDILKILAEENE